MIIQYAKEGTQAEYDALSVKDENTIYYITDTNRLYKGSTLYSEPQYWKRICLGDYNWTSKVDGGNRIFFTTNFPTDLYNLLTSGNGTPQQRTIICRKYSYHAYAPTNKCFIIGNYLTKGLHIRDDSYTAASKFKDANLSTYMYYLP